MIFQIWKRNFNISGGSSHFYNLFGNPNSFYELYEILKQYVCMFKKDQ